VLPDVLLRTENMIGVELERIPGLQNTRKSEHRKRLQQPWLGGRDAETSPIIPAASKTMTSEAAAALHGSASLTLIMMDSLVSAEPEAKLTLAAKLIRLAPDRAMCGR
jgi:hypothetical protein